MRSREKFLDIAGKSSVEFEWWQGGAWAGGLNARARLAEITSPARFGAPPVAGVRVARH